MTTFSGLYARQHLRYNKETNNIDEGRAHQMLARENSNVASFCVFVFLMKLIDTTNKLITFQTLHPMH